MIEDATAHVKNDFEGVDRTRVDDSAPLHRAANVQPAPAEAAGEITEKYKLLRSLGRGGMGEVFEAVHVHTSRRVAVKILHAQQSAGGTADENRDRQTRFAREAQIIGQIRSPHVVEVYDAGVTGANHDSAFIAMELMHGEDLSAILGRTGPLPVETVVKIAVQAARGLMKAHEVGVVHRDIKPANLFLSTQGEERMLKILDFGVARITSHAPGVDLTQDLTNTGTVVGSPAYMPPEQVRGRRDLDHRADIWSLCASLYKLLCGRTPHTLGENGIGELLVDICCKPADPVRAHAAWVPIAVSDAVMKGLALEPGDRYATTQELLTAFQAFLGGEEAILRDADIHALDEQEKRAVRGALSRTMRRKRKRSPLAYAVGILAATVAGVSAFGISFANVDPLQAPRSPLMLNIDWTAANVPDPRFEIPKIKVQIQAPPPTPDPCKPGQEMYNGACTDKCRVGYRRLRSGECFLVSQGD